MPSMAAATGDETAPELAAQQVKIEHVSIVPDHDSRGHFAHGYLFCARLCEFVRVCA